LIYDVYFGDTNPPQLVSMGQSNSTYNPGNLDDSKMYYWRVIAHDDQNNTTEGDLWSFITVVNWSSCGSLFTDPRDGQIYSTVQIGDQCWLKENLDVGTMINGNDVQTDNGIIEKYCYDNNASNCNTYGGLYQWKEAMQYVIAEGTQGICPNGWHVPTYAEFKTLETFVNDEAVKLIDESQTMDDGLTPTNETGFSALFAGNRGSGGFQALSNYTSFWSATEGSGNNAYHMYLYHNLSDVYFDESSKKYGFSVRCLKD
jgi:uncharacterized protein (TIGR02145 family)